MEGVQTAAQEKECVTVPASGDEFFEGRGVLLGKLGGLAGQNFFRGCTPGPGIGDAYISEAMSDSLFQILSASFAEPAEKEFVGKADFKRMVGRNREGKWSEPRFRHILIKVCLEPAFYLHSIGNKGRILPSGEGESAPFAGI